MKEHIITMIKKSIHWKLRWSTSGIFSTNKEFAELAEGCAFDSQPLWNSYFIRISSVLLCFGRFQSLLFFWLFGVVKTCYFMTKCFILGNSYQEWPVKKLILFLNTIQSTIPPYLFEHTWVFNHMACTTILTNCKSPLSKLISRM